MSPKRISKDDSFESKKRLARHMKEFIVKTLQHVIKRNRVMDFIKSDTVTVPESLLKQLAKLLPDDHLKMVKEVAFILEEALRKVQLLELKLELKQDGVENEMESAAEHLQLMSKSHKAYFMFPYTMLEQHKLIPQKTIGVNSRTSCDYHDIKPVFKNEIPVGTFQKMMEHLDENLSPAEYGNGSIAKYSRYLRYIPRRLPTMSKMYKEGSTNLFMRNIAGPCIELFKGRDFGISLESKSCDLTSFPVLSVKKGDHTALMVETKRTYGVAKELENCMNSNLTLSFKSSLKQVAIDLVHAKTTYYFFGDFINTLVLRLRRPSQKRKLRSHQHKLQDSEEPEIEFDYKLININDSSMTLQAVFAALSYHQSNLSEAERREQEETCKEVGILLQKTEKALANVSGYL